MYYITRIILLGLVLTLFSCREYHDFYPIKVKQRVVIDDNQQVHFTYSGEFLSVADALWLLLQENKEIQKEQKEQKEQKNQDIPKKLKEIEQASIEKHRYRYPKPELKKNASGYFELKMEETFPLKEAPNLYDIHYLMPITFQSLKSLQSNYQLINGVQFVFSQSYWKNELEKAQYNKMLDLLNQYQADIEIEIHPKWVKTVQGKTLTPADWDALPDGQNGRKILKFNQKGFTHSALAPASSTWLEMNFK